MTVIQINTFPYKATGSIMMNIHQELQKEGQESYVAWGRGRNPKNDHEISIKDDIGVKWHGIYTRLTDKTGFASKRATKKLVQKLEEIKPDIIHLHNIHGYYLNVEILFNYLRASHAKVVWTLHDCWPFTGHCAYFDRANCDRWQTGCNHCPEKKEYPRSLLMDSSKWNWQKKKELFTGIDITFVTPCEWLKIMVKKSFFKDFPVEVINNGIDTNIFHPTKSNFREENGLLGKTIILGVASEWTDRKGLKDFIALSERLDQDRYQIVLVGLTQKQIDKLPKEIMGIRRTDSVQALAELYSTADYFFNPTYEDNYPTTNLEAQACGTTVIMYRTGGSPETIKGNGIVFEKGDLDGVVKWLLDTAYSIQHKIDTSAIDRKVMVEGYLSLYKKLR